MERFLDNLNTVASVFAIVVAARMGWAAGGAVLELFGLRSR